MEGWNPVGEKVVWVSGEETKGGGGGSMLWVFWLSVGRRREFYGFLWGMGRVKGIMVGVGHFCGKKGCSKGLGVDLRGSILKVGYMGGE